MKPIKHNPSYMPDAKFFVTADYGPDTETFAVHSEEAAKQWTDLDFTEPGLWRLKSLKGDKA